MQYTRTWLMLNGTNLFDHFDEMTLWVFWIKANMVSNDGNYCMLFWPGVQLDYLTV